MNEYQKLLAEREASLPPKEERPKVMDNAIDTPDEFMAEISTFIPDAVYVTTGLTADGRPTGVGKNNATFVAHVNWGKWIAWCPYPGCNSAESIVDEETGNLLTVAQCADCLHVGKVVWPDDKDAIDAALARRRVPSKRNWYPKDHFFALEANVPHGQTADDLNRETDEEHARDMSTWDDATDDEKNAVRVVIQGAAAAVHQFTHRPEA